MYSLGDLLKAKGLATTKTDNSSTESNSKMKNLGYLFYKKYYESDENGDVIVIKDRNNEIESALLDFDAEKFFPNFENIKSFRLQTIYPGLLIGSGYSHDIEDKEANGYRLGFYFDHTTGLPIIPGSSIKGLLKAYIDKSDYFRYVLDCEGIKKEVNYDAVVKRIFEGVEDGKNLPIHKRDIFLDAYPVNRERLMGSDYITPHKDPLKNPVPIKFLKVLPKVTFKFNFILRDDRYLSADEKLRVFKKIILDVGVGAKTNVGYGKFRESKN